MSGVDLARLHAGAQLFAAVAARPFHARVAGLRFSVRLALAMMAGSVIALRSATSGHGNWVLLTIAVVMRAGYGLTKQRRDDRSSARWSAASAAAGAVAYLPPARWSRLQGFGVGLAHGFARLNYRIASVGASVMALVSLHLAQPWLPAPISRPPRRHADRRGDRPSLQLCLAALGIRRGAAHRHRVCRRGLPLSPASR